MTIYYVSPLSGNDTTGDGSAANPWKHITKANENMVSGDECRVEATTANTDLSGTGTATPTNGSSVITTSTSFTGVLSAGDFITFDSSANGGGNGAAETVYKIKGITATNITLYINYFGTASGTPSTVYKINPVVQTYDTTYGARANIDGCVYSGGWTDITGTPTRNSYTFLKNQVTSSTTNRYAVLLQNSIEFSYLNFLDYYYGLYIATNSGPELTYCTSHTHRWGLYINTTPGLIDSCVLIGAEYTSDGAGIRHIGDGYTYSVTNCIIYAYKYHVYQNYTSSFLTFDSCKFYGVSALGGINTASTRYTDCVFDSNYTDFYGSSSGANVFENCEFNNASYCSVYMTGDVPGNSFYECDWNNCNGTYGAIYNYRCAVVADGCNFYNCIYGIRSDVLAKSTTIRRCYFESVGTYGIYINARGTPVQIEACSVHIASLAKALYVTPGGDVVPAYTLKNSFGMSDGSYYDLGSITIDSTTTYNSKPTVKVQYTASATDWIWKPLFRVMVNSATETTFDWYHKFDSSWDTEIELRWVLNGAVNASATSITSFPSTFTNITRTCSSGDITEDGVLSLEFRPIGKTQAKSMWVGGFSV